MNLERSAIVPVCMAAALGGCNFVLGLDQYRDYCPPRGVGAQGECVADGSGGGTPSGVSTSTSSASGKSACESCAAVAHGTSSCTHGTCEYTCDQGHADCDHDLVNNGCETDLTQNLGNCGGCGKTCSVECKESACNDPVSVSAGLQHGCAIRADGSGWCWGSNDEGQLGDGTTTTSQEPVRIAIAQPLLDVSAGGDPSGMHSQTCAVTQMGSVYCWGTREGDAIPDGSTGTGFEKRPTLINPHSVPGAKNVRVGYLHGCAIDSTAALWCWGLGTQGQLGTGMKANELSPKHVFDGVESVALGSTFTCLLTKDGSVYCAGSGLAMGGPAFGKLTLPFSEPVDEIAGGGATLLLRTGADVYCYGSDYSSQCKINFTIVNTPTKLSMGAVSHIAVGTESTGFLLKDSSVTVWGNSLGPSALSGAGFITLGVGITDDAIGCVLMRGGEIDCWRGGDGVATKLGWMRP